MKITIREQDRLYLKKKLSDIESEIAALCGVSAIGALMAGKVTDSIIKKRDDSTDKIEKIIYQIVKRVTAN